MIDRKALYKRCKGYCDKCGGALPEAWAAHHRRLRSQGGKDSLDNILALHHECHNLGTDSVHLNVRVSRDNGWLVSAYADPAEVPALIRGRWYLLTQEGEMNEQLDAQHH